MMPPCDQVGTPKGFDGFRHFTSSTTSGSASWMRLRIRVSISPRQSPSAAIFASISREVDSSKLASIEPLLFVLAGSKVNDLAHMSPRLDHLPSVAGRVAKAVIDAAVCG